MNHQEAQRHFDMANKPAYMEQPVKLWQEAMGSFDSRVWAEIGPGCHFPWPPMHLFWGGARKTDFVFLESVTVEARDRQPVSTPFLDYFFYLQCTNFSSRIAGQMPGLTTCEWCGVLSNIQWKRNWPPADNNSMDGKYDGEVFYWYGCPEFFSPLNDVVKSSEHVIKMDLDCGFNPITQNLDDLDFRYSVMYWLTTEMFLLDFLKLDEGYWLTRLEHLGLQRCVRLHAFVFLSECPDPAADRPWQSNSPACCKCWIKELWDIMV